MSKYYVGDHSGDIIEEVDSVNDGLKLIKTFEKYDKHEGLYEPNFYEVMDENLMRVDL